MRKSFQISLIFMAGLALLFFSPISLFGLEAGMRVTAFFDSFLGESSELALRVKQLEEENKNLKAAAFAAKLFPVKTVKVYSAYPSNNVKEIAVASGTEAGVKDGAVVTYGKNILVGKVQKAYTDYSIVKTIFDPSFEIAVRIGEGEADALLKGGASPSLHYISSKAAVSAGDQVFTASLGFPYGLVVGEVGQVEELIGSPLKSAGLKTLFEFADLRNVTIRI